MNSRTALLAILIAILAGLNVYQALAPGTPELSDEEIVDEFHRLFVDTHEIFNETWFGVETWQHPFDVWITQEIIWEVRPDVIVETGTLRGGSAALWASILEHANPDGRVLTIDIYDGRSPEALALPVFQRRVDFLLGSSTDPKVVSQVAERVQGKKVLVILDSLHTKEHVLDELKAYAPLVSVGSYLIVQDTHLGDTVPFWFLEKEEEHWIPGPRAAVEEFIAGNDRFTIDRSRERLLATNNRRGFLKKVR
jgi:cephalosporin hydroxylase